jgi:hypothetical protein
MAVKELVPLKVSIGLKAVDGSAEYPNFNLVSAAVRKGMDWSKYIDVHGTGWCYDQMCGHKEDGGVDSPVGHQCGCMCVPEDFALEAVNLFPATVSRMTPSEYATFHDTKGHVRDDEETIDAEVLNGLAARRNLMIARGVSTTTLDKQIDRALDPLQETEMGVRKNKDKKFVDFAVNRGIVLKDKPA